MEEAGAGVEVRRLALSIALALTIAAIATGTWVLGSGTDPVEEERATLIVDVRAPGPAQPPVSVAPLPASAVAGGSD